MWPKSPSAEIRQSRSARAWSAIAVSGAAPKPMSRTSVASWPRPRSRSATARGKLASIRKCAMASGGNGVVALPAHFLVGERNTGADVVRGDPVVLLNGLKTVAARQGREDHGDGRARAANHGL